MMSLAQSLKNLPGLSYEELENAVHGANFSARGFVPGHPERAKYQRAARKFLAEGKRRLALKVEAA